MVLIMLMLFGYQMLVPQPEEPTPITQVASAANKPAGAVSLSDSSLTMQSDSATSTVQDLVIETEDAHIVFSNKGGGLKEVSLKKYKTYDQKPLYLIAENHNDLHLTIPTQTGDVRSSNVFFSTDAKSQKLAANDSLVI